jgi:hypothetical protein
VAVRTVLATAAAAAVASAVHVAAGATLAPDPSAAGLAGIPGIIALMIVVTGVFGGIFVVAALTLRIDELRSIFGIMVDAFRRPRRS